MKTKTGSNNTELKTYTPRVIALGLLAVLLLLALTGCRNEKAGSAQLNPARVYTLVSVDGKTVPCDISHEGAAMHVQSGVFTIVADGTCSSDTTFNVASHPAVNRVVTATWTQHDAELTMRWQGAGITMGIVNGSRFIMTNEGRVFAYRK